MATLPTYSKTANTTHCFVLCLATGFATGIAAATAIATATVIVTATATVTGTGIVIATHEFPLRRRSQGLFA